MEGDEGTCEMPGSGCCCCCCCWRAVVEDANDGEVAEEGSRGGVVGELGERSGREE
jgi:hypothetical protein